MQLTGPDIGMAPPPGSKGVIGMPVWLCLSGELDPFTLTSRTELGVVAMESVITR
ncbi:hypothetical protein [Flindersiella endophytica]